MPEVTGNKPITVDLAGHTLNRSRTLPDDLDFSGAVNDLDIGYLRKILIF